MKTYRLLSAFALLAASLMLNARQYPYPTNTINPELEAAAKTGDPTARYLLGYFYLYGMGGTIDKSRGIEILKKEVSRGNPLAMWELANDREITEEEIEDSPLPTYLTEIDSRQLYERAFPLLLSRAEAGDSIAMERVITSYEYGYGVEKNIDKTYQWLQRAATAGNLDAAYRLGYHYMYDTDGTSDLENALKWYSTGASFGCPLCLESIAEIYLNKNYAGYNPEKAVGLLADAFDAGDYNAAFLLGVYYMYDNGKEADVESAIKWYSKGAELDESTCINNLLEIYLSDDAATRNTAKAFDIMLRAAEGGRLSHIKNVAAIYYIGRESGFDVDTDYTKSIYWLTKAIERGDTESMRQLADMYLEGRGTDKNVDKGLALYHEAIEMDSDEAMFDLAYTYQDGKYLPQDINKAIELYTRAAEHYNSDAMVNLAFIYASGDCVEQDYGKAIEWYEKAAELDNTQALFNLSCYNSDGIGCRKDQKKALEYCTRAAEGGNQYALNNLGLMYRHGQGVKKNYTKAINLFSESAEMGNPWAMVNLGSMYDIGEGVNRNSNIAVEHYTRAAAQDFPQAMVLLAYHFIETEPDIDKALMWIEKAIDAGVKDANIYTDTAKLYLQKVNKERARDYIDMALELDADFVPAKELMKQLNR